MELPALPRDDGASDLRRRHGYRRELPLCSSQGAQPSRGDEGSAASVPRRHARGLLHARADTDARCSASHHQRRQSPKRRREREHHEPGAPREPHSKESTQPALYVAVESTVLLRQRSRRSRRRRRSLMSPQCLAVLPAPRMGRVGFYRETTGRRNCTGHRRSPSA